MKFPKQVHGLIFFMVPFLTCFYLGGFIHRVSNIFEKWRAEGQEKIKFHRKIQPSTQEMQGGRLCLAL